MLFLDKKLFYGILLPELGQKERGEMMRLVDREELKKIQDRRLACEQAVDAMVAFAERFAEVAREPPACCKEITRVLYSLNEILIDAAKTGREIVPVLCLNLEINRGGFKLRPVHDDRGKLVDSPIHVHFFMTLELEGLQPFIKKISSEEAIQGYLPERTYIFVRLP